MSINGGLGNYCTNATGGLSRLFCAKCGEETPHKHGICTRSGCGTRHAAYPVRDLAGKWVAQGLTVSRRMWKGAKK